MAHVIQVIGGKEILERLRRAGVSLGSDVARGLKKAGLLLQRYSMEIVPVDLGNLKASAGTDATGTGWDTDVVVFYTAHYAVYVHENTTARHGAEYNAAYPGRRSRGENQQAKFLETPAREHGDELLDVIAGEGRRTFQRGSL